MNIYDCFLFYNELKMLKFRLTELDPHVEKFILVESNKTFSGKPKEYFFELNKAEFEPWLHKIIHIKVDDNVTSDNAWHHEAFQRNQIIQGLKQIEHLSKKDAILISDVDEFPCNKHLLQIRQQNSYTGINAYQQDFYYYNLSCFNTQKKWAGTVILNPQILEQVNYSIEHIRQARWSVPLIPGGWHFSYFGDIEYIKNKIRGFSHQEYNNEKYLNDAQIEDCIKNQKDLFLRDEGWGYRDIDPNSLPVNYTMLQ